MGLDMFLYSTDSNHRRVQKTSRQRQKEFADYARDLLVSDGYSCLAGVERRNLTDKMGGDKEKRDLLSAYKKALRAKAHSLGGICRKNLTYVYLVKKDEYDHVDEIGHWSKKFDLHSFIISNFGDPKDDNLTEVYLDEAALKKIFEKFKYKEFRTALSIVKGGGVVYYYAWY